MSPNRGFCNIFCSFLISKSTNAQFSNKEWSPCHDFYQAQRVSLFENSHFHEHRPHGAHSLLEKRPMTHFQRVNGGYVNWNRSWDGNWDGSWVPEVRGPAGRAAGCPYPTPWPGKFFHAPPPPTHTDHTIDFINPDCHLLGKKKITLILRSQTQIIYNFL